MPRKIIFGKELRNNCSVTMKLLHRAVASSLGPSGKLSLLGREKQSGYITKDGVSICSLMLPLEDEAQNLIAQKILEIATKTNSEAGDGTTTSIVLANALFREAVELINEEGLDPVFVKEEIEKVLPIIMGELDKKAIKIETFEDMENVATISANNDKNIGNMIAKAIDAVGEDGFVTLTEGDGENATLTITEGMPIKKGPSTTRYLKGKNSITFDNPSILIIDGKVELQETLNDLYVQVAGRPFVIIGELSQIAEEFLLHNSRSGQIDCVHILPPMFKELRIKNLEDIATVTGAKIIDPINYNFAAPIPKDVLGKAEQVTFNRFHTNIIKGAGSTQKILERVAELKDEMNQTNSQFEKDMLRERIGNMTCGAAVIGVGGRTEDEILERKDRFEDALNATRAALLEGVIPGGGFTLFQIAQKLKGNSIGVKIFKKALEAPLRQIVANTGVKIQEVVDKVIKYRKGYDAKLHKFVDLHQSGIIDPVKATKSGLKNAVSIVDLLINLEVLTINILNKDNVLEVADALKGINANDI